MNPRFACSATLIELLEPSFFHSTRNLKSQVQLLRAAQQEFIVQEDPGRCIDLTRNTVHQCAVYMSSKMQLGQTSYKTYFARC